MVNIFVFSGTGNTLYCAKEISKKLNEESKIISINFSNKNSFFCEADKAIFMFPIYAYTIPSIVREFIKNITLKTSYIACVVTYGSSVGYSLSETNKLFLKKNLTINYFSKIKMPENIGSLFKENETKNDLIISLSNNLVNEISYDINNLVNNKTKTSSFISLFPKALYRTFERTIFIKNRVSHKRCNKCRLCTIICPLRAIRFENNAIKVNHSSCTHCQRCINNCPKLAITLFFQNHKDKRYTNKYIKLEELL
ncbi:MAG: EFR1 family ferrodoxin [Acholeplasmatales bacterium]|jgi:Fe-S-cluster-containing hydrogenase component 2|nr:EFR1 family ferrodoxin [Acholeplasmatales bacterium]